MMAKAAAALATLLIAGVAVANPSYDPAKPHHTPDGFRNNEAGEVNKPPADLLRWR